MVPAPSPGSTTRRLVPSPTQPEERTVYTRHIPLPSPSPSSLSSSGIWLSDDYVKVSPRSHTLLHCDGPLRFCGSAARTRDSCYPRAIRAGMASPGERFHPSWCGGPEIVQRLALTYVLICRYIGPTVVFLYARKEPIPGCHVFSAHINLLQLLV